MSKKINKNITDSEELFKRLETGNDAGLDDFEKEAFEGFAALNDVKLSQKLNEGLDSKINEVYFKQETKKNGLAFFSMAAGLLLMIGVSIFFYQYLNSEKKDVAMSDVPKNEVTVMENAPPKPEEQVDAVTKGEKKEPQKTTNVTVADKVTQEQAPKDSRADNGKEFENSARKSGGEGLADDQDVTTTVGTGAAASSPVVAEEKLKSQAVENKSLAENRRSNEGPSGKAMGGAGGKDLAKKDRLEDKEKSKQEIPASQKEPDANNSKDLAKEREEPNNTTSTVNTETYKGDEIVASDKKTEDGQSNENTAHSKVSSRDASKNKKSKTNASSSTNAPSKEAEAPGYFALSFKDSKYSTAQQYVKAEIEKDNVLKENVKDFKAKLFVDETGKVIKVNFITEFKKCADCDERLGKILLNMPGWNSVPAQGKTLNRETLFDYTK